MADDTAKQVLSVEETTTDIKKSSKGALVAGLALVLAIGLGIWWTLLRIDPVKSPDQSQSETVKSIVPIESFTVNLADAEDGRFLRATLALGVDGTLPTSTKSESKAESGGVSIATIRDSIITVLAQYHSEELLRPEGKLKLKKALITALNRDIPDLQVREIYFTEFLVQR